MKKSAVFMLVIAVGLGGVSAYLAREWIHGQVRPAPVAAQPEGIATTTVVVAKRPLKFGDPLAADFLQAVSWPSAAVPAGSFKTVQEVLPDTQKRFALKPIEVNEPVLAGKISGPGEKATLSRLISAEMRAVTIRVNDVVGVAGFVLPGDRVDVLVTRSPNPENAVSDVVMQNIKVLGIDQEASEDKDKPTVARAVTLEVTPEQAQKLALAAQVGQLTLALRNEINATLAKTATVDVHALSNTPRPAEHPRVIVKSAPAKPSEGTNVTVVRGLNATTEEVRPEPGSGAKTAPNPAKPLLLQPRELSAVEATAVPAAVNATVATRDAVAALPPAAPAVPLR